MEINSRHSAIEYLAHAPVLLEESLGHITCICSGNADFEYEPTLEKLLKIEHTWDCDWNNFRLETAGHQEAWDYLNTHQGDVSKYQFFMSKEVLVEMFTLLAAKPKSSKNILRKNQWQFVIDLIKECQLPKAIAGE